MTWPAWPEPHPGVGKDDHPDDIAPSQVGLLDPVSKKSESSRNRNNAAPHVRFVVHMGDVKAGSERCDDALLQKRIGSRPCAAS
jgi:hypothetical protein